jgi:hypothetical protein
MAAWECGAEAAEFRAICHRDDEVKGHEAGGAEEKCMWTLGWRLRDEKETPNHLRNEDGAGLASINASLRGQHR